MTHRMTSASSMRADAAKFGAELTRAMAEREVGQWPVKEAAKVSRASIVEFRNGRNLPTTVVARRLADALRWPKLLQIVIEARTRSCQVCGHTFVQDTGRTRKFCTVTCRNVAGAGAGRPRGGEEGLQLLRGEMLRVGPVRKQSIGKAITLLQQSHGPAMAAAVGLQLHQDAVHAMCGACEPEGYCHQVECPLRSVSPLPLAGIVASDRTDIETALKPAGPYSEAAVAARAEASRAMWATRSPEERLERSRKAREAKERMSPEARAEMGRRIGAANAAHNRERAEAKRVAS